MQASQFILPPYQFKIEQGRFRWSSPSNIALVKYWGKRENQIPENPSISFTLNACKTITTLSFETKKIIDAKISFDVYFDGVLKPEFNEKIASFFKRIEIYIPFLKAYHFTIETANTFPHSSGIASSASGMSALAVCLMSIEKAMNPELKHEFFNKKASFLARLGSGSACRSIEGDIIVWGKHKSIEGSSDLFGIKYPYVVHENFKNYHDTILLVDKGIKEVSSTVGHNLMHDHPFAQERFKQANTNLSELLEVFKSGDLIAFIEIMESEALSLHAMMMTSSPSYFLMKPNTLHIINKIREFRQSTGLNIGFTLDAGANVHVLYPENEASQIYDFISNELIAYCENEHYICDQIGFGAKQL